MLSQGWTLVVQMLGTVLLARLLTPADFGLVTMVTTFSFLFLNVGLNGFTEAIVQREEVTDALASNLFWINVALGIVLSLGFAAFGIVLARFYHDPIVARVAAGLSPTIFLTSASVLHLALLRRALCFTMVSSVDVVSRTVSIGVTIALAWADWGYWALVGGAIAQYIVVNIGAWSLCRWIPKAPRRVSGTMSAIKFATNIYGFFALNYTKSNVDNLLVGWHFGSTVLGLYKKAFDLFCLPGGQLLNPCAAVAVPTLSRLTNDLVTFRRYILRAFSILAFLGMGLSVCFMLIGKDLILVVLGPKWQEAGRIFTLFGPGIGGMFLYAPWGWITVSIGRAERYSRWGFVELTATAALFLLALRWGPVGVAVAWSLSFWMLALPATWYAGKPVDLKIAPIIGVVWRYMLAAVLACVTCDLVLEGFPSLAVLPGVHGAIVRMVSTSSLVLIVYVSFTVLLHRSWQPVQQILALIPDLAPGLAKLRPTLVGTGEA